MNFNLFRVSLIILILSGIYSYSQDVEYGRYIIEKLSSKKFAGRGYVKNGDKKAARFIRKEFKKNNTQMFNNNYFQPFSLSVNTFPERIKIEVNEQTLEPADDFIIYANSPSAEGKYEIVRLKNDTVDSNYLNEFYEENDLDNKILVAEKTIDDSILKYRPDEVSGLIFITDRKLYWFLSNSGKVNDFFTIDITEEALHDEVKTITIDYKSKFIDDYETQNVIAYVKGKSLPDSFFVFTAHYDHLGYMGRKAFFPGANDNASGTAMVLSLSRYFADPANRPDYSVAFMAFAAEETGLNGSRYYVNNPLFPLDKIKFVINLDMIGTGSKGITVVNGKVFDKAFDLLNQINDEKGYLKSIKSRGEACNSDHCPFYMSGVPSIFIYTRGDEFTEYHNPGDLAKDLPLTEYKDLFRLLVDFVKKY